MNFHSNSDETLITRDTRVLLCNLILGITTAYIISIGFRTAKEMIGLSQNYWKPESN